MTHEEWWAHMTAYFAWSAEDRRLFRAEYRRYKRESTQADAQNYVPTLPQTRANIAEMDAADARRRAEFDEEMRRLAEERRERDQRLFERIDALLKQLRDLGYSA
jgi:hypothetical protein